MMTENKAIFAYPTESFYALGADATNPQAIKQLFRVKHREPGKPIALIAADLAQVEKYFSMSTTEIKLARKHWPGPLTILLRPKPTIATRALLGFTAPAGHATGHPSFKRRGDSGSPRRSFRIGVRVPAHAGARKLCAAAGVPLTATSANISGRPPTKSKAVVEKQFPGIMIAPGRCGRQSEPSTVVAIRNNCVEILRPGAVKIK